MQAFVPRELWQIQNHHITLHQHVHDWQDQSWN